MTAPTTLEEARCLTLTEWIQWRYSLAAEAAKGRAGRYGSWQALYSGWRDTVTDWRNDDWQAFRTCLERFFPPDCDPLNPSDSLPDAERTRRDIAVQRFISRMGLGRWSRQIQLRALSEDAEENPNFYPWRSPKVEEIITTSEDRSSHEASGWFYGHEPNGEH